MTDRSALPDCHVVSSHQLNHSIPINIESRSVTQMKTFADLQYILIYIYIDRLLIPFPIENIAFLNN